MYSLKAEGKLQTSHKFWTESNSESVLPYLPVHLPAYPHFCLPFCLSFCPFKDIGLKYGMNMKFLDVGWYEKWARRPRHKVKWERACFKKQKMNILLINHELQQWICFFYLNIKMIDIKYSIAAQSNFLFCLIVIINYCCYYIFWYFIIIYYWYNRRQHWFISSPFGKLISK